MFTNFSKEAFEKKAETLFFLRKQKNTKNFTVQNKSYEYDIIDILGREKSRNFCNSIFSIAIDWVGKPKFDDLGFGLFGAEEVGFV